MSLFVFACACWCWRTTSSCSSPAGRASACASYLLVGYYYAKPSAAAAARKAFLVTRLGDIGLLLGIFLLWQLGGCHTDLTTLFDHIAEHPPDARRR